MSARQERWQSSFSLKDLGPFVCLAYDRRRFLVVLLLITGCLARGMECDQSMPMCLWGKLVLFEGACLIKGGAVACGLQRESRPSGLQCSHGWGLGAGAGLLVSSMSCTGICVFPVASCSASDDMLGLHGYIARAGPNWLYALHFPCIYAGPNAANTYRGP